MLHTMHGSEIIRHNTLDHAGIMFVVTDLIRDMLISLIKTSALTEPCVTVYFLIKYIKYLTRIFSFILRGNSHMYCLHVYFFFIHDRVLTK